MGRLSEVFELFCSLDLDVTGIDLPGHGLSKGPRGHIPSRKRLYDDLDAIRQQAEATTDSSRLPQFVYGHSLGGHLALLYGLRRAPELDGVIASSPLIAATQPPPLWKLMVAHSVGRLLPSLAEELRKAFGGANILPSYGMTECMPISSPPYDYELTKPGTSGVAVGPQITIFNSNF